MKNYTINYKEEKYPDLLIQCAHDLHHDFFDKEDTIKVEIQKGGSRDLMTEDQLTDDESDNRLQGPLKKRRRIDQKEQSQENRRDSMAVEPPSPPTETLTDSESDDKGHKQEETQPMESDDEGRGGRGC